VLQDDNYPRKVGLVRETQYFSVKIEPKLSIVLYDIIAGPSGLAMISLQEQDSLLVFECNRELMVPAM
jgi:hypothetical protein